MVLIARRQRIDDARTTGDAHVDAVTATAEDAQR
jgi:hypothetical protein